MALADMIIWCIFTFKKRTLYTSMLEMMPFVIRIPFYCAIPDFLTL